MMTPMRSLLVAAILAATALPASAQEKAATSLFKVVTVKDDIVIGLNTEELDRLGGKDAGAVAKALASKGELTVWQYAVGRDAGGNLQQAPLRQVGILAHSSLRVEPYSTPMVIVPHQ